MSNFWGGHILLDPSDMERMFSEEDSWSGLPTVWDDLQEESLIQLDQVKGLLSQIPAREADFIELYFFHRLRQTAIAELFYVSQPTVCYRLQRGAERLRYLTDLPEYTEEEMEESLSAVLQDPIDVKVMMGMVRTTCQSDVARELGVTQGFVRHRFLRTIDRLEQHPCMETYVKIFRMAGNNLNILKNTCRSRWSDEIIYSIC